MSQIKLNYKKDHKVTVVKIFNFDKFPLRLWHGGIQSWNLMLMAAAERAIIASD